MNIDITIGLDGKPDKGLNIVAYVFDQKDILVGIAPLKDRQVQLKIKENHSPARLFFAPLTEKRKQTPTIGELERLRAYEPVWHFDPKKNQYELLPIPEFNWKWWFLCSCRVRGRVVKSVNFHDVIQDMPVCHARVHICEVDPLWLLIPRLPDSIIDRIRDELLKPWPPIPIPLPDPPPFQFDTNVLDVSPINVARMQSLQAAPLAQQSTSVSACSEVMLNPQPLPPQQPELLAALRVQLTLASTSLARQALLDNAILLRPYLCWWPWIWPYFYRCDEIAVLDTDNNGRFDTTIFYPCFGDHPDLYFWVEYSIGGVFTTVYNPPLRCNTRWNYVCGSDVIIHITDPRVPWCGDPNPLPGKQVAVLAIGNGVSMTEIRRASAGVNEGLTTAGEPFGGSLEPHVWFGDGLISAGIDHYRWSYRHLTRADGSAVSDSWHAMDEVVVRHYGEILADSTLTFKPYLLGPDPLFVGQNLFKIRPVNPPLNVGAVSSSWAPEVDGRSNTASAFFLSYKHSSDAIVSAGKYELKLELFKSDGSLVNLSDAGVLLKVPTIAAPFGAGTVPTQVVAHYPAQITDMEDRVIRDVAGKIVAFRLILHVDNNNCQAVIYPVSINGTAADSCGFLQYSVGDNVHVSYWAYHPNNFASFNFTIARGSAGVVESASGAVGASPVNGYVRDASSVFSKDVPVATLLGACKKAAFAENLHVNAWATDGWNTLSYLNKDAIPVAFALEPKPVA
ncbi:MAG: hypothetical protein LUQ18_05650 [Methylococcaceae bacterium]|nr:hypothetical protein [Methylococcaceae bacterium]